MAEPQHDATSIHRTLCRFLQDELLEPGAPFDDGAELATLGVDSFALMEVLLFVEREWGTALPMDLLTPDNTRTARTLSRCVAGVVTSVRVA